MSNNSGLVAKTSSVVQAIQLGPGCAVEPVSRFAFASESWGMSCTPTLNKGNNRNAGVPSIGSSDESDLGTEDNIERS
jgi:hypothetical protein